MMQSAASIARRSAAPLGGRRAAHDRATGERLALRATAVVIAALPLAVPAGPANIVPTDGLIAVALMACLLWGGASVHRWRLPYAVPVGLLLVGGALGALAGPVPATGLVALVQDTALIALCWAVVNVAHSPENFRLLITTWAYSAVVWVGVLYIGLATGQEALTGQTANQGSRVQLTLADPSYAANYFVLSLMILWATGVPRNRAIRYLACAALVVGVLTTGSNSGLLSLIVATAVAAVAGARLRWGLVPSLAVAAALVLCGVALAAQVSLTDVQDRARESEISFLRDGIGRGTSVEQRGTLLAESVDLYRDGSLLGEGPVSTKTRLRERMAPFEKEAHDDYAAALTERGAIGFAGVLLLVAGLVARLVVISTERLRDGFAAVVTRPNALAGAVVGTLAAGTVYELLHVRHVWVLFAFVAALCLWGRR